MALGNLSKFCGVCCCVHFHWWWISTFICSGKYNYRDAWLYLSESSQVLDPLPLLPSICWNWMNGYSAFEGLSSHVRFSIQVGFWNFRFMRSWVNELVNQMIITKILLNDALSISSQNNTAWYSKLFCQVECLCSAMRHRVTWSNSKPGSRLIANCILGDMIQKWYNGGWLGVYSPKAKW